MQKRWFWDISTIVICSISRLLCNCHYQSWSSPAQDCSMVTLPIAHWDMILKNRALYLWPCHSLAIDLKNNYWYQLRLTNHSIQSENRDCRALAWLAIFSGESDREPGSTDEPEVKKWIWSSQSHCFVTATSTISLNVLFRAKKVVALVVVGNNRREQNIVEPINANNGSLTMSHITIPDTATLSFTLRSLTHVSKIELSKIKEFVAHRVVLPKWNKKLWDI